MDSSGTIEQWELRETLLAMGQVPSDEDMAEMFIGLDTDESGGIDFSEFVSIINRHKRQIQSDSGEADTIAAWVAMGGNADKTGEIIADRLRALVKRFELNIDIEQLLEEADADMSGFIDYNEFKIMFEESASAPAVSYTALPQTDPNSPSQSKTVTGPPSN
mmetsp:Transcript_38599/g.78017  ORF Transcript_38599/g.78017 Transcript_38599/m.78017 type:complete len:162 (+) Transcript_38599:67-552(+)